MIEKMVREKLQQNIMSSSGFYFLFFSIMQIYFNLILLVQCTILPPSANLVKYQTSTKHFFFKAFDLHKV